MSLSNTASLLTESHIVIDSSTDECNDHSKITLVQIHLLPAKMNSKLTNCLKHRNQKQFSTIPSDRNYNIIMAIGQISCKLVMII